MKNLTVKNRILLGYITPLFLFILLGGIVYSTVLKKEKLQAEVTRSQQTIIKADQLVLGLSKMLRTIRGQVISPKDATYRQNYEEGLQQYQQAVPELQALVQETQQKERLNNLLQQANQNINISNQVFDLLKAGKNAEATELISRLRMVTIDNQHEEILKQEKAFLAEKTAEETSAKNLLILAVVIGSLISAITTITTGLVLASGISKTINQAASVITTSSTQISANIEQQERTTSQQAASVNETTSTMDELEASCRQSTEQAKAAVSAAQQALALAQDGTLAVKESLEGMFILENKVGAIAEQIVHLSEQASQIGSISEIVSDLAHQTNMLALNSSVEAVRAGEHGKGFAVVANEIRRLSDQSQKSADKINVLVSEIQSAINSTVMVTEEGTKTVQSGVKIAQTTDKAFVGVADAVNHMVLNNQQISLNLKQQLNAIQQVVEAMEAINKGAKETAIGISQTRVGTDELNKAALALIRMV